MTPQTDMHGRQLSAVVFVHDYLQLQFDGTTVTQTRWPVVHIKGKEFRHGTAGYRDALCEMIQKVVDTVDVDAARRVKISFDDGSTLTTPLAGADGDEPETIRIDQQDGKW